MTPAAKPVKARRTIRSSPFFKKNTLPAPNDVPTNGRSSSANTCFVISGRSPPNTMERYFLQRLVYGAARLSIPHSQLARAIKSRFSRLGAQDSVVKVRCDSLLGSPATLA